MIRADIISTTIEVTCPECHAEGHADIRYWIGQEVATVACADPECGEFEIDLTDEDGYYIV